MQIVFGLLVVLVVNALPFWGVFGLNLDPAQLLVLFWVENAASTVLIGARILIHRRLSRKRGHWDAPMNFTLTVNGVVKRSPKSRGTALEAFLWPAAVFTLAQGAFVLILAHWMLPPGASLFVPSLWLAIQGLLVALAFGFASDLVGLRDRPFAFIRRMSSLALGRVAAVHLLIFGGVAIMALVGNSKVVLGGILAVKLLADLAGVLPPAASGEKPLRLLRFLGVFDRPGQESFAEAWLRQRREEVAAHARDEEIWQDRKRSA